MEAEQRERRQARERTGRSPRPHSVGTGTLEKKTKDLNKATSALEAKVRNLQQKTRSLPRVTSGGAGSRPQSASRELPTTPQQEQEKGRKGSTVTSRVREREAEFQKQVHSFIGFNICFGDRQSIYYRLLQN